MSHRPFLTKEAPKIGSRQVADFVFHQASREEIQKQLGLDKGDDLPDGYIAGWASTEHLDHYRHVVEPGAFDESINAKGLTGPKGIKLLIQHDSDKPAGIIRVLETRGRRLWIEAELNLKIGYVRDMYEVAKMQGGLSFSVGFFLEDYQFKEDANKIEYLHIMRGELTEVSVVVFPGNDEAQMTYIKGITDEEAFETIAELEKALVACGLAKSRNAAQRLTRVVKRNSHLFAAPPKEPPVSASTTKALDDIGSLLSELRSVIER